MQWIVEVQYGSGKNIEIVYTSDPMPIEAATALIGVLRAGFVHADEADRYAAIMRPAKR